MKKILDNWVSRYFGDEEAVLLALLLLVSLVAVLTMGHVLAPIVAALVLAFLLQGVVARLERWRVPHLVSVITVFVLFIGVLLAVMVFLIPLVGRQATNLVAEVPRMVSQWQQALLALPEQYPHLISEQQLAALISHASGEVARFAENLLSVSFSKVPDLMGIVVYLFMVPLMVFFLLKDRLELLTVSASMLPDQRPVMRRIWHEMNGQMANYVRGKAMEILIVGVTVYIAFLILGVNYAALLALLVGLSVVIPYIGAVVVTIPVAMVGYFQWGWGGDFFWLMGIYGVIQFLDGNLLVPLLFSEAVNLHPVFIILAVLVFGAFWGLWGVFFAIPLATLIKALYNAWPRTGEETIAGAEGK